MKLQKITADTIHTVSGEVLREQVVISDEAGKILAIEPLGNHESSSVQHYKGALVPGLINAHCHLELSHMKGKVATGTGLIPFITGVVTKRNASAELIQDAIAKAEQEMLEGGIVAVGDISNVPDTFAQKAQGNLRYYTFIEMFDFLQEGDAQRTFDQYKAVYEQLPLAEGSRKVAVPHAPYSVSKSLFQMINHFNNDNNVTISIHNQETPPENELFEHGKGAFYDFYAKFGVSLDAFEHPSKTAIHYALANMNPNQRSLFVHNTLTTVADIQAAQAWNKQVYWATCPNANLYIENRLPNYQYFLDTDAQVCIGTDSLTSNWQLSILEEMKTIARMQSYVPFETILRWATLNGARALGFDADLGSIEVGKRPGLNVIQFDAAGQMDSIKRVG